MNLSVNFLDLHQGYLETTKIKKPPRDTRDGFLGNNLVEF